LVRDIVATAREGSIMGIEILKDPDQWNRFVDESPYGEIFHRWDLCRIVEAHTGSRFLPYGITKGDQLIALLPLFTRKVRGVMMVSSPPQWAGIPHMGLVILGSFDTLKQDRKERYLEIIGTELARELDSLGSDYFSMVLPAGFKDVRFFQWLGFEAVPVYSYSIDLTPSLDEIFDSFKGQRKTRLRSTLRSGYSVRRGTGVSELYRMMKTTIEEQGRSLSIPGEEYLQALSRDVPAHVQVTSLLDGERVVAACMVTKYKDAKLWHWAGEHKGNVTDLLIWQIIQDAKEEGFRSLELVGANTRHLSLYKNQFNPSLITSFIISRKNWLARTAEAVYRMMRK